VGSEGEVDAAQTRLAEHGLAAIDEAAYYVVLRQADKFWLEGSPSGERWNVDTVLADSATFLAEPAGGPVCCGGDTADATPTADRSGAKRPLLLSPPHTNQESIMPSPYLAAMLTGGQDSDLVSPRSGRGRSPVAPPRIGPAGTVEVWGTPGVGDERLTVRTAGMSPPARPRQSRRQWATAVCWAQSSDAAGTRRPKYTTRRRAAP
jgi:hypothetical protein